MVYNGDEVSALVVDFGSYTTRAGYAGEDCPRVICPSFYGYVDEAPSGPSDTNGDVAMDGEAANGAETKGKRKYYVGDDAVGVWRNGQEVGNFMLDGMIHDAEPASELLNHLLHKRLSVDPTEHPLMITEPAWSTEKNRQRLAEMVFEGEKMPAMYFGSSGVLSAFAAGKHTALVLDIGYAQTCAIPIVDGYALRVGTMRQPLAGALLTSQVHNHFTQTTESRPFPLSLTSRQLLARRDPTPEPGLQPKPLLREDRPATPSWKLWAENSVVEGWKESCAEVSIRRFDYSSATTMPQTLYEFPDGYHQYFGEERYRFPEMLFNPKEYFNQSIEPPEFLRVTPSSENSHSLKDSVPLHQLVHDSIMACDVDVRAALLQNIVVVGNTSLIRGVVERLDVELANLMPSQKIRIHSPTIPFEKKYSSWLGGSVLASLGTFHQLWITRDEYLEHGMNIVNQRCK